MSGPISTGNWGKLLYPGISKIWDATIPTIPEEWKPLFDAFTSSRNYEEEMTGTGFGLAPVRTEGAAVTFDSDSQSFITRYTHVELALGYIITQIMREDNLYAKAMVDRTTALAFSFKQSKEKIAANVYNRATNGSYVGGDGVSLLNTAHPNKSGGSFSNMPSVTTNLSEAALEQAVIDMSLFTNDRGLLAPVSPKILIIPPHLQFEAERILTAKGRVGTDLNDPNALMQMRMFPQGFVVNRHLTSATGWFIRTDAVNGMKMYQRVPLSLTQDLDGDTGNAKFMGRERYVFGWSNPRGLYGSL